MLVAMDTLFYDDQDLEDRLASAPRSLFLAGPTSRGVTRTAWRAQALELLSAYGYDGVVVLPEFRDGLFDRRAPEVFGRGQSPAPNMRAQSYAVLRWETCGIERTTTVLFWMPFRIGPADDPDSLPGFTTRAEVGRELARDPTRLVLGMPSWALSGSHIRYHAHAAGLRIWETLAETVTAAALRR
jgi:hypothetical protein